MILRENSISRAAPLSGKGPMRVYGQPTEPASWDAEQVSPDLACILLGGRANKRVHFL